MNKIKIDTLVIEVTRKCNACCAHCLRGDAENANINKKVLRKLFENVEYVNSITFTGGEPTLYVRALRDTLNICIEEGIEVGYIYVVTNGVKYSQGLVNVMEDWLRYCMGCMGYDYMSCRDLNFYLNDGLFGLSLSIDAFHPRMDYRSWAYKDLPYYSSAKEHSNKDSFVGLIIEGRAEENFDLTHRNRLLRDFEFEFSFSDGEDEIPDLVYCNVYGDIFPCCDMSFERQRNIAENQNVNIFNRSLYDIVHDVDIDFQNPERIVEVA